MKYIPDKSYEQINSLPEQKLRVALADLAKGLRCPFCSSEDLAFLPDSEEWDKIAVIRLPLKRPKGGMNVVTLLCSNCGFLSHFWPKPMFDRAVGAGRGGGGDEQ